MRLLPEARLPSVTRRMDDDSDTRGFRFTLYCDRCGAPYRAETIPYSVRDAPRRFEAFTKAQSLIWESEHGDAYERANQHALLAFTRCRICGGAFCEDCAIDCADDLCADCAKNSNG